MACIVAIIDNGKIWMGGDSAGIAGQSLTPRKDPKVYIVDDFIFGFTTSFRMGQILGYRFKSPKHDTGVSIEEYLNTSFIDHIRELFKDCGYAHISNNTEQGGTFLVGYQGRLFRIESDYQVGENLHPYDAIGCGAEIALGSLYSTSGDPESRIKIALGAAETFCTGVRQPFLIKHLEK